MDFGMSIAGASVVLLAFFTLVGTVYTIVVYVRFRAQRKHYSHLHTALAPGLGVLLACGIYGTLTKVGDEMCELEISPGICIKVSRFSIKSLS